MGCGARTFSNRLKVLNRLSGFGFDSLVGSFLREWTDLFRDQNSCIRGQFELDSTVIERAHWRRDVRVGLFPRSRAEIRGRRIIC